MNKDQNYIISPVTKRPIKIGSRLFNDLVKQGLIPGFEPQKKQVGRPVAKRDTQKPKKKQISNEIRELQERLKKLKMDEQSSDSETDENSYSDDEIFF